MILIIAILAGLAVGVLLARLQKRTWTVPNLRVIWLVILGFLPQFLLFYLPATRMRTPDSWVAAGLVGSQIVLLVFCWFNRHIPGIGLLAIGLLLNFLVITANGGFMPISPQTASHLIPATLVQTLKIGERFGYGKDILLLPENTRLVWFSDRFVMPAWLIQPVAFSLGDILVSLGVFWLLVSQGKSLKDYRLNKDLK